MHNKKYDELNALRNSVPLVGAIRWDAWHNPLTPWKNTPMDPENYIGAQMTRNLSATHYHFRLPFFGIVESRDRVTLPDYTQEIFDREILYAKEAGIDYFMYCWYADDDLMSAARKFHAKSKHRYLVSMCCMISVSDLNSPERMIGHLTLDHWTTVHHGRPLVFLQAMNKPSIEKDQVDHFRASCVQAGLLDPYIIGLATFGITPEMVRKLGLEGISDYAIGLGDESPYEKLAETAEKKWEQYKEAAIPIVPCVMTGWDRRPRIDHPVTWEGPTEDKRGWVATAQPGEIAAHLDRALEWNDLNKEYTPLNSVLIYAWNEHDEGGWLCPTILDDDRNGLPKLHDDGTNEPDTRRLEAIRKVLLARKSTI
jgi:hypothetical protein